MGTPNINTIIEWVRSEYPDLPRIQTTNCRKISGSSSWSQHSWANAADIFVSKSVGDELKPRLIAEFGDHIKTILWQVKDHFDHIHLDTWPTGIGIPPCAGGVLQVRHKDDTIGTTFTDDIQGGDEDMATPTEIAEAVWFYALPDQDDGLGTRGTSHAVKQAWKFSMQAAQDAAVARRLIEQLASASGVVIDAEAIAKEVADEIAERLAS